MPIVQHSRLPTFERLRESGHEVLTLERAVHQDIRELHIGFLNMMPDAALEATERQFIRLVGGCNRIVQFFVYPFSLDELPRSAATRDYIARYYSRFDELRESGLDALIITGANVANPALEDEPFWDPLMAVVDWARDNVASTLCSCLATHAVLKRFYGIDRRPLPEKLWGVYDHRVRWPGHPLLAGINTRFDVPHSRHNDISRRQLEGAGLHVLVESEQGGVHMAVSRDHFRRGIPSTTSTACSRNTSARSSGFSTGSCRGRRRSPSIISRPRRRPPRSGSSGRRGGRSVAGNRCRRSSRTRWRRCSTTPGATRRARSSAIGWAWCTS